MLSEITDVLGEVIVQHYQNKCANSTGKWLVG
jgi:hypothetical protein